MLTLLFRRKTQSTSFIPEIDGLRFFAIITVIGYHFNTAYSRAVGFEDYAMEALGGDRITFSPGWWIIRLDLGVKVFFSISGMVLALPFIKSLMSGGKSIDLKDYYYRRLTRLEPPFILSLVAFAFVHVLFLGENGNEIFPHFVAGLFYLHHLVFGSPNLINPVTWSLETEAQFYVLVPAFFILFARSANVWYRISIVTLFFVASLMFKKITYTSDIKWLQATIFYYLTNFMTGVVFAWLYITRQDFFKKKNNVWDIVGILSILMLFYFYKPQFKIHTNTIFNVATFGLMFSVFKGRYFNWFFTRPFIYIVGGMCYSIYLLHYAFLHLLTKYTSGITTGYGYLSDLVLQLLIGLPLVLLISALFYLLIEKPCMDKHWPQKLMAWMTGHRKKIRA
jgi:peptidoglycan/LPS O-acetylase OafA/YrhL